MNNYLKEAKRENQADIQKNVLDRKKASAKAMVSGANGTGYEPCETRRHQAGLITKASRVCCENLAFPLKVMGSDKMTHDMI